MSEEFDEELEQLKKKKLEQLMKSREEPDLPESPIRLTDSNFQEVIDKYPLLVVDFWAEWCGPCKMMEPIMESLAKKYNSVVFGKLNIDNNKRIANNLRVSSIPTLAIIKDGKIVDRVIGAVPKQRIEAKLNEYTED